MEQHHQRQQRDAILRTLTSHGAPTRRSMLRAAGAALALGGVGGVGGCAVPLEGKSADSGIEDFSGEERLVNFSNWPGYIDVGADRDRHPTLETFRRRTGIRVAYTEDVNSNAEFFDRIQRQLKAGQDTGRDLICVTDWLAARLVRNGWVQKLDVSNLANAYANLSAQFRGFDWDPARLYSYPWTGIFTVIVHNDKATEWRRIDSMEQLLEDPRLKGRVGLLTEMRDTIGMTLLDMGVRPEQFTDDDFHAALARLQRAVDRGQIRRFTGNDYIDDLAKGDIAACLAWAGDLVQLQVDNPAITLAIPDAGCMASTDNLLIPNEARHKRNAERLINYYYEPNVAARLAAWINYVCPVDGVREELAKIDPRLAKNPLILPDEKMTERSHVFRSLTADEETTYEKEFGRLIDAA
ncbi:spermidine/putrescine ABC transporter substrate-binding protein [Streptomyces sp. NPDC051776]|uniref:polyamine ABC transporter substrate-binding protein n=1 Tax=Streptomyces sp. NPDC051776 TaxID=3155414 RepID=UPI00341A0248